MHVGMPITPVTMRPVSGLVTMFLNPSLQTTSTDDYAAGHTDAHKSPVDERYRLCLLKNLSSRHALCPFWPPG